MKYPSKFKKYINQACTKLRDDFYCQEFELEIVYEDEDKDNEGVAAKIRTDFKYLGITIFIHPPVLRMFGKKDYERIKEVLVHEFCHVLTDPIYKIAIDAVTNTSEKFLEEVRER